MLVKTWERIVFAWFKDVAVYPPVELMLMFCRLVLFEELRAPPGSAIPRICCCWPGL